MTANHHRRSLLALSLLGAVPSFVRAQDSDPLSFIVPQPAGAPNDTLARKMQPALRKALGRAVSIENLAGAGGSLGVQKVLFAPKSSQQLLITSQTETILTPLTWSTVRYKSEDLRPVGLAGRVPYVLAGRADLPAANLSELIAYARKSSARPLNYGHIGHGSMIHLLGESWARKCGLNLNLLPYKGVPPMYQDLVGGLIDVAFIPFAGNVPLLIESGKLRAYGVTSDVATERPLRLLPLGHYDKAMAGFVYSSWAAFFLPKATPEPAVSKLHAAVAEALKDPDVVAFLQIGGTPTGERLSLAQLDRFYADEIRLYRSLARDVGMKPQ